MAASPSTLMLMPALLLALCLWTGLLWIVVALHILIDLIGLVVRPSIERRVRVAS